MMDHKMIVAGSLKAVEGGFALEARLPYYRGLGLSMVEDVSVTVDGTTVTWTDASDMASGEGLRATADESGSVLTLLPWLGAALLVAAGAQHGHPHLRQCRRAAEADSAAPAGHDRYLDITHCRPTSLESDV